MAKISVDKSFILVTAADTVSNELEFKPAVVIPDQVQQAWVKVTLGSFKFRVGEAINADADIPVLAAGDMFLITISNLKRNLHFKATTIGDSFIIGI